MGFRITTNMMINTYKHNLMNSTNQVSNSRDKVLTHRNFNSYAEDPGAATQAFRLRRDWYQTSSQLSSTDATYSKFHTAWTNLQGIITNLENPLGKMSSITGNTGTAGESRRALAQVLRETAESVVQSMNQNIGDHFVFAGDDGLNVPCSWDGDKLLYRGVNVNAGKVEKPLAVEPDWLADAKQKIMDDYEVWLADPNADPDDGRPWSTVDQAWYDYYTHASDSKPSSEKPDWVKKIDNKAADTTVSDSDKAWLKYYQHEEENPPTAKEPDWATGAQDKYGIYAGMPETGKDEIEQGWIDYYNDQKDLIKLNEMSEEQMNLDLGMGMKEKDGVLVDGSAFNSALCGINFIDYGVDKGEGTDDSGDPKNLALIMKELADVFDTWDEDADPQGYNPELAKGTTAEGLTRDELEAKAFRLMDKLKLSQENLTEKNVELDARSSFLKTTSSRLDDQKLNLNEQVLDLTATTPR